VDHVATPPTSGAGLDPATLRYGDQVLVGGRQAIFVYLREPGAVVRYHGEHDTRVVSLRKLRLPEAP
jgi:hypothetical protein